MQQLPEDGEILKKRYVVGEQIGRGGFAAVFRAQDRETGRTVALKIILPKAIEAKHVRRRLAREARLAMELTHPNTIKIYDQGLYGPEGAGLPYVVMEYLSGISLGTRLRRDGPLPPEEVAVILEQILGSLAEAHSRGIVHRDLKPDNIFLCDASQGNAVKVLDFGIARAVAGDWGDHTLERLTRTGVIPGTVAYMAPEFFNGSPHVTPAADVYALGCMSYKLIMGKPPFEASTPTAVAIKHLQELPAPLPSFVHDGLSEVLEVSLAKSTKLRYRDAGQMLYALQEKMNEEPAEVLTEPDRPEATPEGFEVMMSAPATPVPDGEPGKAPERPTTQMRQTFLDSPTLQMRGGRARAKARQSITQEIAALHAVSPMLSSPEHARRALPPEVEVGESAPVAPSHHNTPGMPVTSETSLEAYQVPPPLVSDATRRAAQAVSSHTMVAHAASVRRPDAQLAAPEVLHAELNSAQRAASPGGASRQEASQEGTSFLEGGGLVVAAMVLGLLLLVVLWAVATWFAGS